MAPIESETHVQLTFKVAEDASAKRSPLLPLSIQTLVISDKGFRKDRDALLELQNHAHTASEVREARRMQSLFLSPRHSLLEGVPTLPALPTALAQLCNSLNQAFAIEKQLLGGPDVVIDYNQPPESFARLDSAVRQLMSHYMSSGGQDWQQYMAFNPHHYVRHLIDACDDYELMLICWGSGQHSRVHNHATSHCWLTCLMGEVEERQFALPADVDDLPTSPRAKVPEIPGVLRCLEPCPSLEPTMTSMIGQGCTGYINDHTSLHSVGCSPNAVAPGAVTLHLYAPPVRRVQLYEPDEDRVTTRVPGFYSVRGNRV